jgi:hypothetical protein
MSRPAGAVDDADLALVASLVGEVRASIVSSADAAFARSASPSGRSAGSHTDCVAIAPTCGSAQGTTSRRRGTSTARRRPIARLEVARDDRVRRDDWFRAIGQLAQVDLEQLAPVRGNEAARNLGMRERRLDLLGAAAARRRSDVRRCAPRAGVSASATSSRTSASSSSSSPSTAISGTRRPVAPNQRSLTA